MSDTMQRPSIFSLSPAEKRIAYDEAYARVVEAASEAARQHKARKPDPYANEYYFWKRARYACVLVVKHAVKPASFEISRDGGSYHHIYLPFSQIGKTLAESDGDFLMALVSRRWVDFIVAKDFEKGSRLRELLGITLPLSHATHWTEEQCATWDRLSKRRVSINTRIQSAKMRGRYSNISRSDAA